MSEKTTIGGVVYETIGSSSSNLLLKCNGTARIQWGTKLIDLIKNGKIVSENSEETITIVSEESEIKKSGIYILKKDDINQLWICKKGEKYNLTGTDLYISATNKQNITVDQQKQALENIGIYYNTLEEAKNAGIQNGIVYITDTKELYTIKDGVIEEFQAKLQTITVENEDEQGEVINSSFKIVLSILDTEYLILHNGRITANYPIHIKNTVQIGSENANADSGYRLYINNGVSCLDVDKVNIRKGIQELEYLEVTFDKFYQLLDNSNLIPHRWYLIKDYQNPWKMVTTTSKYRPILVRALTKSSIYTEGQLFKDRRVTIQYDVNYQEEILQTVVHKDGSETQQLTKTKGKIIWMKDSNNNQANFDFLDYTNIENEPLTVLYESQEDPSNLDSSIFPPGSYNNSITIQNLKGTVFQNNILNDENTNEISLKCKHMYNNTIKCDKLVIPETCISFCNNTIEFITNTTITQSITNCTFKTISDCIFNNSFNKCVFNDLTKCTFGNGQLENITCYSNIENYTTDSTKDPVLYDISKIKNVYFSDGKIQITSVRDQTFFRGMIVMHSGIGTIPEGWAICDGEKYTYEGVTSQTPNLVGQFIKGTTVGNVKAVSNPVLDTDNNFTLQEKHLPAHSHPHKSHSHTFSGSGNCLTTAKAVEITTGKDGTCDDVSSGSVTISGSTGNQTSTEQTKTWTNESFKLEPNYYALIFIMKL